MLPATGSKHKDMTRKNKTQRRTPKKARRGLGWALLLPLLGTLAVVVLVWCINDYTLSLTVESEVMTVEHGEEFANTAVSAEVYGSILQKEPQAVPVITEGTVDTTCLGEYPITLRAEYDAKFLFFTKKLTASRSCTVKVVDTKKPMIHLVTDPSKHVMPGEAYVEEGFSARDICDGDLSARVESKIVGDEVIYSVADRSGNVTYAVRKIKYRDTVAPELSLQGNSYMFLKVGQPYEEPGYLAVDADEGEVADRVTVAGNVDANAVGVYELAYTVSDSYGNTSTAVRKICVTDAAEIPQIPIWDPENPGKPNGRVIYLTFDDGPSQHTERLLDILDQYNVKATFFVVNTGNMGVLKRMAAAGHTVAMHSSSHKYSKIYASADAFYEDLFSIQSTIYNHTGITSRILRFPGGTSNTISKKHCPGLMAQLSRELKAMGYRYFDWNVDSRDADDAKSVEEVYNNVIKGCGNREYAVVLQHDTMGFSVDAVELIIQWGLSNGYTFRALDMNSPRCEHSVSN